MGITVVPVPTMKLTVVEWGWEQSPTNLVPSIINQTASAPDTLMKLIRCNCTGQCDRKSCTCGKHGLKCVPVCV